MKEEEKLPKLLNELADATAAEPVAGSLAEDIKQQIPRRLAPHRSGRDTVNIMIDLRISRLAAAAVIIITMILSANFLGGRGATSNGIYQDGKLLIKYCLAGEDATKSDILSGVSNFYEYLLQQGRDVVYYGGSIDTKDTNAVLMQWKLPDGKYRVMFVDLHTEEVTAEELVKLQARMLQKRAK